jgi:hypothetical protein
MTIYKIVRCCGFEREIVDEFETLEEARAMLPEYEMSDPSAAYRLRYPPSRVIDSGNAESWHENAARRDTY